MNHLIAIAANEAVKLGFTLDQLRSRDQHRPVMVARYRVCRALRAAGADWSACGRVLGRRGHTLRAAVYRGDSWQVLTEPLRLSEHPHFCDCESCLNGENPIGGKP